MVGIRKDVTASKRFLANVLYVPDMTALPHQVMRWDTMLSARNT